MFPPDFNHARIGMLSTNAGGRASLPNRRSETPMANKKPTAVTPSSPPTGALGGRQSSGYHPMGDLQPRRIVSAEPLDFGVLDSADRRPQVRPYVLGFLRDHEHKFVRAGRDVFRRNEDGSYCPIGAGGLRWELIKYGKKPSNREQAERLREWVDSDFSVLALCEDAALDLIPDVSLEFVQGAPYPPPKFLLELLEAGVVCFDHEIAQEAMAEAMLLDVTKPPAFCIGREKGMAEALAAAADVAVCDGILREIPKTLAQLEEARKGNLSDSPVIYFDSNPTDVKVWRNGDGFRHGIYKGVTSTKFFVRQDSLDAVAPELARASDVIRVKALPKDLTRNLHDRLLGECLSITGWCLEGLVRLQMRDKGVQNLFLDEPDFGSPLAAFMKEQYGSPNKWDIVLRIPQGIFDFAWGDWGKRNGVDCGMEVPMREAWKLGWDLCDTDYGQIYTNDPKLIDVRAVKLKGEEATEAIHQ